MNRLLLTAVLSSLLSSSLVDGQTQRMPARPFIEFEKSRFASTEQVFFWIGVTAPSEYRIPENLWDTGRVIIIRPDGTQKTDVVGRSADGMPGSGWRGGWGLGSEKLQLGVYVMVFEFAAQRNRRWNEWRKRLRGMTRDSGFIHIRGGSNRES